jgi:hypothetical protein
MGGQSTVEQEQMYLANLSFLDRPQKILIILFKINAVFLYKSRDKLNADNSRKRKARQILRESIE